MVTKTVVISVLIQTKMKNQVFPITDLMKENIHLPKKGDIPSNNESEYNAQAKITQHRSVILTLFFGNFDAFILEL